MNCGPSEIAAVLQSMTFADFTWSPKRKLCSYLLEWLIIFLLSLNSLFTRITPIFTQVVAIYAYTQLNTSFPS